MTVRLVTLLAVGCCGCAQREATIAAALPPAAIASPWRLADAVWTGPFEDAAAALGQDAPGWKACEPQQVWLAVYHHERDTDRRATVRVFSFASHEAARRAYEFHRPLAEMRPIDAGDNGTWTEVGVLFVWGRLVFDIFGDEAGWSAQTQTLPLVGLIERRLDPQLTEEPR